VRDKILDALEAIYTANKKEAEVELEVYLNNTVGVGEHPHVVTECDKLLRQIDDAEGYILKVKALRKFSA